MSEITPQAAPAADTTASPAESDLSAAPPAAPASTSTNDTTSASSPAAPAADTSSASTTSSSPAPSSTALAVGKTVRFAWTDPTGDHEQVGVVVQVDTEGDSPRAAIAWFSGVSGLIDEEDLEVLEES